MIKAIKLSAEQQSIAKARMALHKFGRARLASLDVIAFEAEDFNKAVGETIYLCTGGNDYSILPPGSYELEDKTRFTLDLNGCLKAIIQKGNAPVAKVDPEAQKQLWAKQRQENRIDRNVAAATGAPKATQMSRWREFITCRFGSATIYGGKKIKFPNDLPTLSTSPLYEDGTPLQDGIYQVTSPAGELTVKNGLISSWAPAIATQKPAEQKLSKLALSYASMFDDSSERAKADYFALVDEKDVPEFTKKSLKDDYIKRVAAMLNAKK